MNDVNVWMQCVWGTTLVLVLLAWFMRGRKAWHNRFENETASEKWALRLVVTLSMCGFYFRRIGVVDFGWWVISSFGIAGFMCYQSLRLILSKEKAPEAT